MSVRLDQGREAQDPKSTGRRDGWRVSDNGLGGSEFCSRVGCASNIEALKTLFLADGDAHRARRPLLRTLFRQRLAVGGGAADAAALLCDREISSVRRRG